MSTELSNSVRKESLQTKLSPEDHKKLADLAQEFIEFGREDGWLGEAIAVHFIDVGLERAAKYHDAFAERHAESMRVLTVSASTYDAHLQKKHEHENYAAAIRAAKGQP